MSEMMKLTCPGCGRELEIPADLEEFSCLYCGERSKVAELLAPAAEVPEDLEEQLAQVEARLPGAVTRYTDYYKRLTKKEFFGAFERYESDNAPLLREMDELAGFYPQGETACVKRFCATLLDGICDFMEGDKRWKSKSRQSTVIFEMKVVMAIFLTPLAQKMGLSVSESFRKELHSQWKVRFPKEDWTPGDYDVLAEGYRKRKWCYITTATCRSEGKGDDCAELTAFRAFRDGWLTEQGGEELIAEYYDKAPAIVACIDLCGESQSCYEEIRQKWLAPCYEALQQERMEDCKAGYVAMVRALEQRYLN